MRTTLLLPLALWGCGGLIGGDSDSNPCQNPSGKPTELHFINRFDARPLVVSWIDERCKPVSVGTLEPGAFLGQATLTGDRWQVSDPASGELLFDAPAPDAPLTALVFPRDDARLCSAVTKTPVRVTFKNRYADRAVALRWVDFACREHDAGEIAARDEMAIDTLVDHVFRLRQAGTEVVIGDLPPVRADTPIISFPSDGTAPTCSEEGTTMATVGFENHYPARRVAVYWVDYQCHEVLVGELGPGESVWQASFFTHVYTVKDAATQEVLKAPLALSSTTVMVTIP